MQKTLPAGAKVTKESKINLGKYDGREYHIDVAGKTVIGRVYLVGQRMYILNANGTPAELRGMSELAGAVTLQASGASADKLSSLGRVEEMNGAFRIYPKNKSQSAELAQAVVNLVNREGWKVEGMYSERGELDEVFRRITLPDTVKA